MKSAFISIERFGKDQIEFKPRHSFSEHDVSELLDDAAKDPFLGDFIYKKNLNDIVLFTYDGELAGFAIPRKDSDGHYRTGPIFVRHGYRKKGIAKKFAAQYFLDKRGRAWIEETNVSSQRLYLSIGFKKTTRRTTDGDGVQLYEYLKD